MKPILLILIILPAVIAAQAIPFTENSTSGLTATFSGSLDYGDVNNDGNVDFLQLGYTVRNYDDYTM